MESKPRILCLHGGGTSAMIFRFQTIRLRRELDSTFDFVFLDAPFLSKAGPGVLPVFEDCGPYYSWIVPGTPEGKPVPNESIQLIQKAMDDQVASTGKPFVGILGFSQGTKIGSGLLLQQQSDREKKQEQKNPLRNADFRFGVFLMGGPPLLPPQYPPFDVLERCATPSVHVVGLEDPLLDFGRVLCSDFFEMDKVKYMELAGVGHHLPDGQSQPLTAKIARAILDVWAVV